MRIGFAKDIHKFKKGRKLILGGVEIPNKKGLDAHSDGDVLAHAISDSLIGAIGIGDLGKLFPDNDNKYKNFNSLEFLKEVRKIVDSKGYIIDYIDTFISCEKPKLASYTALMKHEVASALGIDASRVSIKCGTNEGLGYIGKGKGIECFATCILKESKYE